jgi:hypothetical protein
MRIDLNNELNHSRRRRKSSNCSDTKCFKTVYNETDILPRPRLLLALTLASECKYLSEGIKFNSTYCSFHVTQCSIYNSIQSMTSNLPPKNDARSLIRLLKSINRKASNLLGTHEKANNFAVVWQRKKFQSSSGDNRRRENCTMALLSVKIDVKLKFLRGIPSFISSSLDIAGHELSSDLFSSHSNHENIYRCSI